MGLRDSGGLPFSKAWVFDMFCFWDMTIDILFLPFLPFIAVSVSVVVGVSWMVLNLHRLYHDKEWEWFVIMLFLMLMGTIMTAFYTGTVRFETSVSTSIKRFLQYGICFCYYFFYKSYFEKRKVDIRKIIFWAVIFMALFALAYRLFPEQYAALKIAVHPSDNHTRRFLANMVSYRFNYLWTDPNNIAYLAAGVSSWYCLQNKNRFVHTIIVLLASFFIIFCTVSNGGLIIFIAMITFMAAGTIKKLICNKGRVKTNVLIVAVAILFAAFFLLSFTSLKHVLYDHYIVNFLQRLEVYLGANSSPSGGRFEDLMHGLAILSPVTLILGTGQEGIVTEIGHIYWIGMYGVLAYFIFMYLMFRKNRNQTWRSYLWVIPFFVGFSMNIAIGEFKWMAVYLLLLAYSRSSQGQEIEWEE